jgi:hypothetical protein
MRAIPLLFVLLAGCATTADIQGARDSWQGATYDEVVGRWGAPHRHTVLSDGGYVYTWEAETVASRPAFYPSIGLFGGSGGGVGVGTGVTFGGGGGDLVRCDRTLVFRNARVAEQTWQGEPQFCSTFRRS